MNILLKHHQVKQITFVPNADLNSGSYDYTDTEYNLAVLTLYDNGTIRECSRAAGKLLDCVPSTLIWQHISTILPQLAEVVLVQGERINPNLRFLSRVGHSFEVVGMSGVRFASTLFFNDVENFGRHCLRLIIQPIAQEQATS